MLRRSLLRSARPKLGSKDYMALDAEFACGNYTPLPVVVTKGKGSVVWDPEGNKYYDMLAGYGAVNFGHSHPRIIKAAQKQLDKLTLCSRAFYNDKMGPFCRELCKATGYQKALLMNTGGEAVESAVKLCRAWGYKYKGIPQDEAIVIACSGNFHGRMAAAVSVTDEIEHRQMFGPCLPGFVVVPYGDAAALEAAMKQHGAKVCAFMAEPIQGECGVIIPPEGYFAAARKLCDEHNIPLVLDEVQSGIGRTAKFLAQEHEGIRADVTILAKAIGGGVVPLSAVVADDKYMRAITSGTHGSTFGGNPLACGVGLEVLRVIEDEGVLENAVEVGKIMEEALVALPQAFPLLKATRCRGMWGAIEVKHDELNGAGGKLLARQMLQNGVLSKVTHDHTLRLSPPLVMTKREMKECMARIEKSCKEVFSAQ